MYFERPKFFRRQIGEIGFFDSEGCHGFQLVELTARRDDFSNQSGILFDGHMFNEAVVIDKEGTGLGVFF